MKRYTGPRRALVSVSDKAGLLEIVEGLAGWGIELVSTGGTARAIKELGFACTPIEKITGFPEIMDGRVKTLHPKVHGALLKVRGNPEHENAAAALGIGEFDFVIVNPYPFGQAIADPKVTIQKAIEQIDIGGPSMLRSGAKNFEHVTVVVDPADYDEVILSMVASRDGQTSLTLRRALAAKVFKHTGAYDTMIGEWLWKQKG